MKFDVIVSGLNVVDLLVRVPPKLNRGKKHKVESILIQGGAPAGNAACGMAALGLKTAFLGYAGNNIQSKITLEEFQRCGVDTSLMLFDEAACPAVALVEVETDGERTVLYSTESYRALSATDIQESWVSNTHYVLVDGYDIEGNIALLKMAKEQGKISIIDIEAGESSDLKQMLLLADHVILPLEAAQNITQKNSVEDCLKNLKGMSLATLIVTDGANGSWGIDAEGLIYQKAFCVEVVDTTGCGDAYHAAYIYALTQNYILDERMYFAAAFAALVAQHLGGRTIFPTVAQVKKFMKDSDMPCCASSLLS